MLAGGVSSGGWGWGCSPLLSVTRGLLLAHPVAMSATSAWEAARVEALQARLDLERLLTVIVIG